MKPYVVLPGLLFLALSACASAPKPAATPPPAPASTTTTTSAEMPASARDDELLGDLVFDRPALDPVDYRALEEENAANVMKALEPDLLACYKRRVAVHPQAHAFMTIDVVVAPDGHVQNVETTGGALLGDATLACITKTIQRASFDPPHNGGTMRVHVPLALRKAAPGEAP